MISKKKYRGGGGGVGSYNRAENKIRIVNISYIKTNRCHEKYWLLLKTRGLSKTNYSYLTIYTINKPKHRKPVFLYSICILYFS